MQVRIISGAMPARRLHMLGPKSETILSVSLPHLLRLMTRQVLCFAFSVTPSLFL